jgi:hypothetical protein
LVISVVAKKCRSAWKVPCSFGHPAASRQLTHSRDQVRSVNGLRSNDQNLWMVFGGVT